MADAAWRRAYLPFHERYVHTFSLQARSARVVGPVTSHLAT